VSAQPTMATVRGDRVSFTASRRRGSHMGAALATLQPRSGVGNVGAARRSCARGGRAATLVLSLTLLSTSAFALAGPARAQTDPYTGGGVQVQVQVTPGVFISVTAAVVGQVIRIQGCL